MLVRILLNLRYRLGRTWFLEITFVQWDEQVMLLFGFYKQHLPFILMDMTYVTYEEHDFELLWKNAVLGYQPFD